MRLTKLAIKREQFGCSCDAVTQSDFKSLYTFSRSCNGMGKGNLIAEIMSNISRAVVMLSFVSLSLPNDVDAILQCINLKDCYFQASPLIKINVVDQPSNSHKT